MLVTTGAGVLVLSSSLALVANICGWCWRSGALAVPGAGGWLAGVLVPSLVPAGAGALVVCVLPVLVTGAPVLVLALAVLLVDVMSPPLVLVAPGAWCWCISSLVVVSASGVLLVVTGATGWRSVTLALVKDVAGALVVFPLAVAGALVVLVPSCWWCW